MGRKEINLKAIGSLDLGMATNLPNGKTLAKKKPQTYKSQSCSMCKIIACGDSAGSSSSLIKQTK